jgi:hypothetical protein
VEDRVARRPRAAAALSGAFMEHPGVRAVRSAVALAQQSCRRGGAAYKVGSPALYSHDGEAHLGIVRPGHA